MSKNADGKKFKQVVDTFTFYGITQGDSPQPRLRPDEGRPSG